MLIKTRNQARAFVSQYLFGQYNSTEDVAAFAATPTHEIAADILETEGWDLAEGLNVSLPELINEVICEAQEVFLAENDAEDD